MMGEFLKKRGEEIISKNKTNYTYFIVSTEEKYQRLLSKIIVHLILQVKKRKK